jgi:hypothetical protein
MVDFGNALAGAATGSAFGPLGALAGGAAGLFGFGKGKKEKIKQLPNYTPDQMQLINQFLEQAKSGTGNAFDYLNSILSDEEGNLEDFQRPAMEDFQRKVIPSILERFTGMGAGRSSALNQTLGEAGKSFGNDLAAQRAQLKQNAVSQLQQFSEMGLRPQNTPYIQGGTQGAWNPAAAGSALGSLFQGNNNANQANGGFSQLLNRFVR